MARWLTKIALGAGGNLQQTDGFLIENQIFEQIPSSLVISM
jgi:hypothetical protein